MLGIKNRNLSHRGSVTGGCGKNQKPSWRGSVMSVPPEITVGNKGGWSAVKNMVVVVVVVGWDVSKSKGV